MKRYTLVKKALALTMSCTMLFSLAGCSKSDKENKTSIKIHNENGEDLVVIALVDKINGSVVGDEMYGYINKDLQFNSATKDYKIDLNLDGNTNCDVYYIKYVDCMSDDDKEEINEVSSYDLNEFENRAYVLNRFGAIKLSDSTKEINMDKLDYRFFIDSSEKDKVMIKKD